MAQRPSSAQPRRLKQTVSLRWALILPFVVQIVGATGLVGYLSFKNGQQEIEALAHHILQDMGAEVNRDLSVYLATSELVNRLNGDDLRQNRLTVADQAALENWLLTRLLQFETVRAIHFATPEGVLRTLYRNPDLGLVVANPDRPDTLFTYPLSATGERLAGAMPTQTTEPWRDRPWYRQALMAGAAQRHRVVYDANLGLVLNVAEPVYDPADGTLQAVVAVDIPLAAVSEWLKPIAQEHTGDLFIIEYPSGRLVALSSGESLITPGAPTGDSPPRQRRLEELDNPLLLAINQALRDRLPSPQDWKTPQRLDMAVAGEQYFVYMTPFQNPYDLDWLIVATVPESGYMADIEAHTRITILLCIGAAIAAAAVGIVTARWIIRPLLNLNTAVKAIAQGQFDYSIRVERADEVGELAASFKQMTEQLQEMVGELESRVAERTDELFVSKSRLNHLLTACPAIIYSARPDGDYRATFVSNNVEQLLGYTAQEFLEEPSFWLDRIHPDDRASMLDDLTQHLNQGQYVHEYRFLHGDGSYQWLRDEVRLIRDEAGVAVEVVGFLSNISDRKQAEESLRRSEASMRAFISALPDLILRVRQDGTRLIISTGNVRTLLPDGPIIGGSIRNTLPPHLAEMRLHYIQKAVETQQVQVYEYQIEVEGELQYEEARVVAVEADEALVIVRDISDRKRAEMALTEAAAFLRSIYDGVEQSIFVVDLLPDGSFRYAGVNPTHERLTGLSVLEVQGKRPEDILLPDVVPAVLQHYQDCVATGSTITYEEYLPFQGYDTWWITSLTPLRNEHGQINRIIGTSINISDRKQAELDLQRAKDAAEVADKAKSAFLANMSHELRTPLNVILGFTQVMELDSSLTADQRENLQSIHRSGDHLLNLINDILDLSKIEAGHLTLDETTVDLTALLVNLHDMFRQKAEDKGIVLHLSLAPELPQLIIADEKKLRQVLINLLSNAIKFTQMGYVVLHGNVRAATQEGVAEQLQFAVEDTGVGISTHELTDIFNAFVQTQAGKMSPEGTGLGLTISRRFVQLMGGTITVDSQLNQGSTFTITLPLKRGQGCPQCPTPNTRKVVGLASPQSPYRILVVDDQPENRQLLVKLLAPLRVDIQEARDGEQAVECWQQWYPHLIWMDLRMPGIDGYEATRTIRERQVNRPATAPEPVIIALTAQVSTGDRAMALAAGCNAFISKPFQDTELFARMAEYLRVDYVYAEDAWVSSDPRERASSGRASFAAERLRIMPQTWLMNLYQAALYCDDDAILQLTTEIPPHCGALVIHISQLARDYQFHTLAQLAQTALGFTG